MLTVTAQRQRLQAVHSIFTEQKRWRSDYKPQTVWTTAPPGDWCWQSVVPDNQADHLPWHSVVQNLVSQHGDFALNTEYEEESNNFVLHSASSVTFAGFRHLLLAHFFCWCSGTLSDWLLFVFERCIQSLLLTYLQNISKWLKQHIF